VFQVRACEGPAVNVAEWLAGKGGVVGSRIGRHR